MNFIIEFQRFDCFGAFIEDFVFLVRIRCVLSMIERKIVGVHAYEVNGVFKGTLKTHFQASYVRLVFHTVGFRPTESKRH